MVVSLEGVKLDEVIVSFDVSSLYTKVPVQKAIDVCDDLLYSGKHELPPVSKDTFKELVRLCTCNRDLKLQEHGRKQCGSLITSHLSVTVASLTSSFSTTLLERLVSRSRKTRTQTNYPLQTQMIVVL